MANQSPDRREILAMLGKLAAIGQFPGFVRWVHAEQPDQPRAGHYQPIFFSPAEFRTLETVTEMIIPRDETPGAKDAGVAEFIDFMVAHDEDIQSQFKAGLASQNPEEILKNRDFFKLLREYTVIGFYTTRIGLEELNYPGLKFYSESPACPHPDNPEHR